jgi:hypothetical protein
MAKELPVTKLVRTLIEQNRENLKMGVSWFKDTRKNDTRYKMRWMDPEPTDEEIKFVDDGLKAAGLNARAERVLPNRYSGLSTMAVYVSAEHANLTELELASLS